MKRQRIWNLACVAATLVALCAPVRAQSGAALAPADTGVFIEIDNAAQLREQWHNDPLGKFIEAQIDFENQPVNDVWLEIQHALGMTGQQVFDTYFGSKVMLLSQRPGDNQPTVILSRVKPGDGDLVIERLMLQAIGTSGDFKMYRSADSQAMFGFTNGWMAMGGMEHSVYVTDVLGGLGQGDTLANQPAFKKWTDRLPKDRFATAFIRGDDTQGVHALSVSKHGAGGKGVAVRYFGEHAKFENLFAQVGAAKQFEFGPLADWTVAAVSINLAEDNPPNTEVIDAFIAPKTLKGDILSKLTEPIVLFVGSVPRDQLADDPGLAVPVLGVALKMSDQSVAADLDVMINKAVMFANIAATAWETDPIVIKQIEHDKGTFHSANFGQAMAQRAQVDALNALGLSYGRIGDWYLVCTQEQFYRRCLSGEHKGPAALPAEDGVKPIVQFQVKSPALAGQLDQLLAFFEEAQIPGVELDNAADAKNAVKLLSFFDTFSARLYKTDDGLIDGRFEINRQPK